MHSRTDKASAESFNPLPTLFQVKRMARQLRDDAAASGTRLSRMQALEQIAARFGARDWNTLSARIAEHGPPDWTIGQRVSGRYLSQVFTGTVLKADPTSPGWTRLVLDFDQAVDVVRSEGFSNFRKRVHATVGRKGHTREATSDGVPHLRLDPVSPVGSS